MARRLFKQLCYGIFYGAVIAAFAYGILRASAPSPTCVDGVQNQNEEEIDCGGPCATCAVRHLSPLEAGRVAVVRAAGAAAYLIEARNPNASYGARDFIYELDSVSGHSFIYAGEIKRFVVVLPSPDASERVPALRLRDPVWRAAEDFPRPQYQIGEQRAERISAGQMAVSGIFGNTNAFALPVVEVGAALYDETGALAGLSETVIRDVRPFEERFFKVLVPVRASAGVPTRTELIAEIFPPFD